MICCLLAALCAGNLATAARLSRRIVQGVGSLQAARLVAALAGTVVLAPVTAAHAAHYAEQAEANGRSIVAEIIAQPLCAGPDAARQPRLAGMQPTPGHAAP